ncbi:MAG: glutathione S-transferase N-terminal domain-containing protein [gamma proteobacterium symbiont of Bathyaustriella thionipta]|nr:glutathione S-transferase N-terminal domain-containing protein [gamma proteobacterium symbiont of Bathyaustriella thionipta]MCU7950319.1 glutathione S-transferase N-terminal domain-containing protein [gamma proteobacterium symbiont of Bathyaustriella thionipta]MCU7954594.1 glutathione S-transferase N-terminal domain-containing protein [gamma proteobacterium symbiont of Bathyaustriella thionipta]MCU7956839.1 glutathione S-transferase N-terminal domain-containing protein [gamma proteobacterium 
MKLFFRIFFKTLRFFLEPLILLWDKLTPPKGIIRSEQEQSDMDKKTQNLALYQFNSCPFCIKVRRQIKRQSLAIQLIDAQHNQQHKEALLNGGGAIKVPCLKMINETGEVSWLYESNDIIRYLQDNFS